MKYSCVTVGIRVWVARLCAFSLLWFSVGGALVAGAQEPSAQADDKADEAEDGAASSATGAEMADDEADDRADDGADDEVEGSQGQGRKVRAPALREAERYAEAAFEAYRQGDVTRAIALYQRAQRAAPSADIDYNLAKIYDRNLGDHASAIQFYGRYVADPLADPVRAEQARARLEVLKDLQEQARASALAKRAAQAAARKSDAGLTGTQIAGIITSGLGVAGVGGALGFGYIAKKNLADADCTGSLCETDRDVELVKSAQREAIVATWGTVGGLTLLVAGATMFLLGDSDDEDVEQGTARLDVQVRPWTEPGLAGSQLWMRW